MTRFANEIKKPRISLMTPPSKVRPLERVDFRCARLQAALAVRAGRQGRLTRITAQTNDKHADHQPPNPNFLRISAALDASFPLVVARFMFQPATFRKSA